MSEGVAVIRYVYEKTMGEAMVFCDRIGRLSGGGRMRRPVQASRVGFKHDAVAEYEFVANAVRQRHADEDPGQALNRSP